MYHEEEIQDGTDPLGDETEEEEDLPPSIIDDGLELGKELFSATQKVTVTGSDKEVELIAVAFRDYQRCQKKLQWASLCSIC